MTKYIKIKHGATWGATGVFAELLIEGAKEWHGHSVDLCIRKVSALGAMSEYYVLHVVGRHGNHPATPRTNTFRTRADAEAAAHAAVAKWDAHRGQVS